jgi:hypothetical protein
MTEEEKNGLVYYYNSKPPAHCVYHGKNYPGVFPFIAEMYEYSPSV